MKTLDEVIEKLEHPSRAVFERDGMLIIHEDDLADALQWLKGYRAHIELDKLRDKSEAENEPLSWSELRTMEGKPVWLEDSNQQGEWVLLSGMEDDVLYFVYRTCNEYKIYRKEQGTFWQAYRKERYE